MTKEQRSIVWNGLETPYNWQLSDYEFVFACVDSVASFIQREILYFKHFYEHFTFGETDWSKRGKRLEKYVRVAIAIELVTVGTKIEDL